MYRRIILVCVLMLSTASVAFAFEEYNLGASLSSQHFRVLDPQHGAFGGTASSSSSSFRLLGAIGDLAIASSSGSLLALRSGFLYFPLIVAPVPVSAVAGANSVTLTWTAAQAGAGLIVKGYIVCTKPGAGTFACTDDVSNVLTFQKTGLTGGTLYTFKFRAYDFYNNVISESDAISATPTGTPTPTPGGGGGGGGGGFISPSPSVPGLPETGTVAAQLTGLAFPLGTIHVLYNGVEIATTQTDTNAVFVVNRSNFPPGTANFGFWGIDRLGRRSVTWAFSVPLPAGGSGTTRVSGLIVPPTIELSTTQVNPGTPIFVSGESVPGATVEVLMTPVNRSLSAHVAPNGSYTVQMNTDGLTPGVYDIKARTLLLPASDMSTWTQSILVGIGVPAPTVCNHPPDVNHDSKINLVDFSIMAFWWKRAVMADNPNDLNCDLKVDLADFSILAYYWTGR